MIISAGAENTFDKNSTFKGKKLRNKNQHPFMILKVFRKWA